MSKIKTFFSAIIVLLCLVFVVSTSSAVKVMAIDKTETSKQESHTEYNSTMSTTDNGITISVKNVLYERTGVDIIIEVSSNGETPLDNNSMWEQTAIRVPYGNDSGSDHVAAVIKRTIIRQSECKRLEMLSLVANAPIEGGKIELALENLISPHGEIIVPGNWTISWEANLDGVYKVLYPDINEQHNKSDVKLSEIVITSSAITIKEVGKSISDLSTGEPSLDVVFNDGRQITLSLNDKNSCELYVRIDDEKQLFERHMYFAFNSMIDPADVSGIFYSGTEISLTRAI